MSEIDNAPRSYSGAFFAVLVIALLAAIGSLVWCYLLGSRLTSAQAELADAKHQSTQLAADLRETNARLKVTSDEMGKSLGLTQKQMEDRAQAIVRQEEADNQRLATAQQQTAQQVKAVSSEVSSVKSDVGGVRSDLGKTQSDLATTINQLQSVRGDLSSTNSVIARNHDELVLLQHKGDRTFYEFTLIKGQKKSVGTISMELKKADPKKNVFTLEIVSDDKLVTKRDKGVDEPLQFYSGKDPALFEVVVNAINSKNQVTGYLSAPKNAPAPVTAP